MRKHLQQGIIYFVVGINAVPVLTDLSHAVKKAFKVFGSKKYLRAIAEEFPFAGVIDTF